jgi:1-deoxy-D-xylulose-5-phosphate reductoisomerase
MNKGFEVIEAKWLFSVQAQQIKVLVHPQSVIHSMVQFSDGAIKAQLGEPSMLLPIQYAFTYPLRIAGATPRVDFTNYPQFNFLEPDINKFPCLGLAYEALRLGGNAACVINAANEIAVDLFLKDQIRFTDISQLIEKTLAKVSYIAQPTIDDYCASNTEARVCAQQLAQNLLHVK